MGVLGDDGERQKRRGDGMVYGCLGWGLGCGERIARRSGSDMGRDCDVGGRGTGGGTLVGALVVLHDCGRGKGRVVEGEHCVGAAEAVAVERDGGEGGYRLNEDVAA